MSAPAPTSTTPLDVNLRESGKSALVVAPAVVVVLAVYLFVSGWTYFDSYYRLFSLNPRWLEINFYETLMKGFTIGWTGGVWVWLVYLIVVIGLVAYETTKLKDFRCSAFVVVLVVVCLLLPVYSLSRQAGLQQASKDQSCESRLPVISFSSGQKQYRGKLLLFRSGAYFVHDVHQENETCDKESLKQLFIFRAEDIADVSIVEIKEM